MEHPPGHACCHEGAPQAKRPWFRRPVLGLLALTGFLYLLSYLWPPFVHYRHAFLDYMKIIALPVVLGFAIGGVIDYYVPSEYVSKFLARRGKRTIFYSVGLGFLMSACSHGILALSMELHKKGASGPAVVSFLMASPWANLPITFLLVGFFGWKGLLIIAAALLVAFNTGLIFQWLDHRGWIEPNKNTVAVDEKFSILADIARRRKAYRFSAETLTRDLKGVARGIRELAGMVLGWILIGMIAASLASAFVPSEIFERFLGPSALGLVFTLALAAVLEVCSEGTSPLAFEIYRKTGALGNSFAFLMGGVATDYTEIGLVWKNLGRRSALWLVAVTLPQIFALGILMNLFFPA